MAQFQKKGPAGVWTLEKVEGNSTIETKSIKETVFIIKCDKSNIEVKNKCNVVSINESKKAKVYIDNVMSMVEVTNCKDVTVVIKEKCPSIAIDKCDTVTLDLTAVADPTAVSMVAASSSSMNVQFTKDGETVEKPLPEQFKFAIVDGAIKSTVSDIYSA